MLQGDAYYLPINYSGFTISQASVVEITLGSLVKYWKSDNSGEVIHDADNECFKFPLSQQETYMFDGDVETQARVKFTNNDVIGTRMGSINVMRSLVRTVI